MIHQKIIKALNPLSLVKEAKKEIENIKNQQSKIEKEFCKEWDKWGRPKRSS